MPHECFSEIEKEQEVETILLFGGVEGVVDSVDVESDVATLDESLLVRKKDLGSCRQYP